MISLNPLSRAARTLKAFIQLYPARFGLLSRFKPLNMRLFFQAAAPF